jgi:hypothetical protein
MVAHEVTNIGTDRHQLSNMAEQARTEMGVETLDAVADRGYYASEEIRACEKAGIAVMLPKPMTWPVRRCRRNDTNGDGIHGCKGTRPSNHFCQ